MSSNKKQGQRNALLVGASLVAAVSAMTGTANAQTAPAPAAAASGDDEMIVVTGTRIHNANLSAPTAVTTMDQQQIENTGQQNLAAVLQRLPSFGSPALSSGNSNFLTTGNGVNTLQLRNLGENRTLTVVNGHRWVPGLPGSSFVDFNTIPTDLVERVEVITGGASAIYGADALAGVINVILRDDYQGLEYKYQYGQSDHDDAVEQRFSVLGGGNFADGKGNAVINFIYSRDDGVLAHNRSATAIDNTAQCALVRGGNCNIAISPTFSSYSAYGRFLDQDGNPFTVDPAADPTDVTPFSSARYGFNRQAIRRYTTPIQRYQLSGLFKYDINDSIQAFTETMYTHVATESDIEPQPLHHSSAGLTGIPCSNPYAQSTPGVFTTLCGSDPTASVGFRRRLVEIGNRGTRSDRNSYRILSGLRGDLPTNDLHWEAFASYGRVELTQKDNGVINLANFRNAVDAVQLVPGGPITCADAFAVATGCVPINLFGLGSITPAAAKYVTANTQRTGFTQQENIGATLTGTLFTMPAGDVQFAAGGEWRRESAGDFPDSLVQAGLTTSNQEGVTEGGYHVGEFYGEVEVPLLHDAPFAKDLSVGAAYRYSSYSTAGRTDAYSLRAQWSPVQQIRVRTQYARAVRVPNIGELFAPAGENFATVVDPCNGVTAADTDAVSLRCLADPQIAARVAATGSFTETLAETQSTGGFSGGGNTALKPEVADSYNIGVVYNDHFDGFGTITTSVDWWRIGIENQIGTVGRQATVDGCFGANQQTLNTTLCNFIVRKSNSTAANNGPLTQVNSTFQNFPQGTAFYEGVDLSVLWQFTPGFIPGDLTARFDYTQTLSDNASSRGDKGDVGYADTGVPQNKFVAGVVYNVGPFQGSWDVNYLGHMFASPGFESVELDRYITHDIRLSWDVTETANFYVGANNAFDEKAPNVFSGVPGNTTGTNTNASQYDPIGRTWYAGVRLRY